MEELKISFYRNKTKIVPTELIADFKTSRYVIFRTNSKRHFIKIYASEDFETNSKMAKLFFNTTSMLNSQSNNVLSVFDITEQPPIVALLIDAYESDLNELIVKRIFTTHFDVFRFLFQMCKNLYQLHLSNIVGFDLGPEKIVMDGNLNFKLTHFDKDLNEISEDEFGESMDMIAKDLAPEYFTDHVYTAKSIMWDLGMMLHKVLFEEYPGVDYNQQQVHMSKSIGEVHKKLRIVLVMCLEWDQEKRPNAERILTIVLSELFIMDEFTLDPSVNAQFKESYSQLLSFKTYNNDNLFLNFVPDSLDFRIKRKYKTSEILNVLLQEDYAIDNELLQMLIKNGWSDPQSHIACYYRMISIVQSSINNRIIIMKVLLILHAYLHRSSHKSLLAVNIQNKNKNLIDDILDPIIINVNTNGDTLIGNYAVLLQKKYRFVLKYIKNIENNFSISKIDIITRWQQILNPALLAEIYEYMQFVFVMFLRSKDYHPNYFTRNMILFLAKEIMAIMGLYCNLIVLLQYIMEFSRHISEDDEKEIIRFIEFSIDVCENNRKAVDVYMMEMRKPENDFEVAKLFITDRNLKENFDYLARQMKTRKSTNVPRSGQVMFHIKDYTRFYIGYLLRLPESLGPASNTSLGKIDRYVDATKDLDAICSEFGVFLQNIRLAPPNIVQFLKTKAMFSGKEAPKITESQQLNLDNPSYKQIAFAKKKEEVQVSINKTETPPMVESESNNNLDQTSSNRELQDSKQNSLLGKNPNDQTYLMNFIVEKKRMIDVAIQNDLLQEEKGTEEVKAMMDRSDLIDKDSSDIELDGSKYHQESDEQLLKSELDATNFDVHNLEKFLFHKFSRSVDEWIVDFNEIEFGKLIATGSTCHVYKGYYKNLPVAIKKLLRPENEKKIKFLKEFKREISLLVSLPAHPSLLTLVGFCIVDGVVYLLTEFCDGGTLFDILYRRSLGFKLS